MLQCRLWSLVGFCSLDVRLIPSDLFHGRTCDINMPSNRDEPKVFEN